MKRGGRWWTKLFREAPSAPDTAAKAALATATIALDERRYAEAERGLRHTVRQAESHGSDRVSLASALNSLAEICRVQAKYDEAVSLYRRTIEVIERSRGAHDPALARSLNGLALIYRAQGQ